MSKPIVIFTIGTQGDIRPCVALGQGLHRAGYPVRIATSANFAELVREAGLEFYPLTADFQAMLEADRTITDQALDLRAMARIFRERYASWAANWVEEGLAASKGAGLLIGVSNSTLLAKALSEAQGIPFAIARLQPLTPSRELPPMVLSGARDRLPGVLSLAAHHLLFQMVWGVMRPAINDIVRPQLGLRPYPKFGPYLFQSTLHRAKVINGFSRHVLPRPADWPESSQVTGYWFFHQTQWRPPEALNEFLAAGPKPVYIGFGSMVSSNATSFTETVLAAIKKSGQARRAGLRLGWAGRRGGCAERSNLPSTACPARLVISADVGRSTSRRRRHNGRCGASRHSLGHRAVLRRSTVLGAVPQPSRRCAACRRTKNDNCGFAGLRARGYTAPRNDPESDSTWKCSASGGWYRRSRALSA